MLQEMSLLPKPDEEFAKGQMAQSVTYVGHKPTTRHEQIQENWHIEIQEVKKQPLRRSPRKKATKIPKKPEQLRRSPRKATATATATLDDALDSEDSEDSDRCLQEGDDGGGSSDDGSDSSDQTMVHSDDDDDDDVQVQKSSRKRLEYDDKSSRKRAKKKRKTSVLLHRDLIAIAKAGDPAPLQDYMNNFDLDRAIRVPMTAAQWEKVLPAWKSKTKARGLKSWKSKTSRGEWDVPGICAKVINQAVKTYMQIFGLPPVFEGGKSGEKIIKPNGVDLFTPFILTVHLAYCKNLNPEVEDGTSAFDKLLQYMHTHRVRIKLLRAV